MIDHYCLHPASTQPLTPLEAVLSVSALFLVSLVVVYIITRISKD